MSRGPGERSAADASPHDWVCAVASITTGAVLDDLGRADERERLEGLAATLPELFATIDGHCLERLSQRMGGHGDAHAFSEILMFSENYLHLIQPLTRRPGQALLAVCSAASSIGLALSLMRERVAVLEGE